MMRFMTEGGINMWVMLISALVVGGVGATRPSAKRAGVFLAGTILLLIQGLVGMAMGMKAVAFFCSQPRFGQLPQQAAVVAEGLGELANNGLLGGALALLLGIAAVALRRAARPA